MSSKTTYIQCLLRRHAVIEGGYSVDISRTCFIPKEYAVLDERIRVKDENGNWIEWEVFGVYSHTECSMEDVDDVRRAFKRFESILDGHR